jgi:hypothetical protein
MGTYKRRPGLLTLVTSYNDCKVSVTKKEYLSITEGFMKFLSDKMIDSSEMVNLPSTMGILGVVGKKQKIKTDENGNIKGLAPDWKSTLELWKENPKAKEKKEIIYFFNEHSGGIRYKFGWLKAKVPLRMKNLYMFIASRNNKRRLWKQILNKREYQIIKNN